ncbi:FtsH-binding integral membrane protein [Actinomadura coerulea]|uniref:FtsH-binding integral membrane protein n=1 Tax=Actinomadura coerulea TaxID=46159 RepID=A0A7X0G854_9ACTN|nr:FtsH-binding integral membrane protein [Actinomadura coerulea]
MRKVLGGVVDVLCVLVFVGIGRASHEEAASVGGFLSTAWPFLVGLGVGWGLLRAWRRPEEVFPAGVGIWVSTVAVGMVLRVVSGQGTALAFVVVATVFLGAALLGWRLVARVAAARKAPASG